MTLGPRSRKLAVTVHVMASVGWIGAVVAFVALAVAAVSTHDDPMARAACLSMAWLISYVIVPFAGTALLTGLACSLGTHWGLFRHYWVVVKLVLTAVAIAVLLIQVAPIERLASAARDSTISVDGLPELRRPLVHAVGGLAVLLVVQALGMYKPEGLTRYGWRKQQR